MLVSANIGFMLTFQIPLVLTLNGDIVLMAMYVLLYFPEVRRYKTEPDGGEIF